MKDPDIEWQENYSQPNRLGQRLDTWERYARTEGPFGVELTASSLGPGQRALDAGCGTGQHLAALMQAHPGAEYHALDFSAGMVAETRKRCPQAHCVQGSVEALPWPDAHFDAVLCMHMLYHVVDIPRACLELARVLRRGGWCLVTTVGPAAGRELWEGHNRACKDLDAPGWASDRLPSLRFNTANGETLLRQAFSGAIFHPRRAVLAFPEAGAALRYYQTLDYYRRVEQQDPEGAQRLARAVEAQVLEQIAERGSYEVNKDCGTWIVTK